MKTLKLKTQLLLKNNWIYFLIFGLIFCYFMIFRFFLIPSGDDYFWWGQEGSYLLHHGFYGPVKLYGASINGRYIGNTLEILTMRHLKIAMIVFSGTWTILIWCMWKLANKTWWALILAFGFVFTLNDALLNTTLVWNAGFMNYVPSTTLILVYLVIFKDGEKVQLNKYYAILTFLIGLVAGLFLEAIAFAQILLGIMVLLFFTNKKKAYHISYLVGALLSLVIIMSHPGYRLHIPYRKTTFNIIDIWHIYAMNNHIWLISLNTILISLILISVIILTFKKTNILPNNHLFIYISSIFLIYYLVVGVYLNFAHKDPNYNYLLNEVFANVDALVSLVFIIYIGICIYQFMRFDKMVWLYYLCAGLFFSPLLFVASPVNGRSVFTTYVFMYLVMIKFVQKAMFKIKIRNYLIVLATLVIICAAANYQTIMYTNYMSNLERVQESDYIKGKRLLNKHIPYRKFVWSNDRLDQQNVFYWRARLYK